MKSQQQIHVLVLHSKSLLILEIGAACVNSCIEIVSNYDFAPDYCGIEGFCESLCCKVDTKYFNSGLAMR